MSRVMVCGPFSTLMRPVADGLFAFSEENKLRIDAIHRLLEGAGHEVLSAHRADRYGESAWIEDFVKRDLDWAKRCDVQLILLPASPAGDTIRSDGTMVELGFANALDKPLIFLADDIAHPSNSFFLRSFAKKNVSAHLPWKAGFETELLGQIERIVGPDAKSLRNREYRTDVDGVIEDLRREETSHEVTVGDMLLTVLPGVLSPRLSHAPDALMSKWHIPAGGSVLDLGCGSGVLGLAALRQGAEKLVALDINPQAVRTTQLNLGGLGLEDRGEARLSDGFSALRSEEAFDVIIFAAPYWDRRANDDLERSCFDEDYRFFSKVIAEADQWLRPDGAMYVIFSDQGDVSRALRLIDESRLRVEQMHISRPSQVGGHLRIIWDLRRRRTH